MSGLPRILIVDDNPNDIELLTMALEESGIAAEVAALKDGRAAIGELQRLASDQPSTWPDVMVLDRTCRSPAGTRCWPMSRVIGACVACASWC